MLIKAKFDMDSDVIECPNDILENIVDYQEQFWKWLFDESVFSIQYRYKQIIR